MRLHPRQRVGSHARAGGAQVMLLRRQVARYQFLLTKVGMGDPNDAAEEQKPVLAAEEQKPVLQGG